MRAAAGGAREPLASCVRCESLVRGLTRPPSLPPLATTAAAEDAPQGEGAVGWRVGVYWPNDQAFYRGEVSGYDAESARHEVRRWRVGEAGQRAGEGPAAVQRQAPPPCNRAPPPALLSRLEQVAYDDGEEGTFCIVADRIKWILPPGMAGARARPHFCRTTAAHAPSRLLPWRAPPRPPASPLPPLPPSLQSTPVAWIRPRRSCWVGGWPGGGGAAKTLTQTTR